LLLLPPQAPPTPLPSSISLANPAVEVDGCCSLSLPLSVVLAISENWRKLQRNGDDDAAVECQNKLLDDDELLEDDDEGNVKVIT
jgi:hypothetical protein